MSKLRIDQCVMHEILICTYIMFTVQDSFQCKSNCDFFSRGQREEAQNFNKVSDKLTVENDPSPRTFPNLKSSGFFFFTAGVVEDVGDWGLEDEEPEAAFCKQT